MKGVIFVAGLWVGLVATHLQGQSIEWMKRYGGPAKGQDQWTAVATDESGNVCVAGTSGGAGGSTDVIVSTYGPTGRSRWFQRWHGSDTTTVMFCRMALDPAGNVIIACSFQEAEGKLHYMLLKYATNGQLLWRVVSTTHPAHDDYLWKVAVDGEERIYLLGTSVDSATGASWSYLFKYDGQGRLLWQRKRLGDATALAIDSARDAVFVAGAGWMSPVPVASLVRYDGEGRERWHKHLPAPGGYAWSHIFDMAVDAAGSAVVAGGISAGSDTSRMAIAKIAAGGRTQWLRLYGDDVNLADANDVDIDSSGGILVAGRTWTIPDLNVKYLVAKFSAGGKRLWLNTFGGGVNISRYIFSHLVLNRDGSAYAGAASLTGSDPVGTDWSVVMCDRNGRLVWKKNYDGPGRGYDELLGLASDGGSRLYAAGFVDVDSHRDHFDLDAALIRYGPAR